MRYICFTMGNSNPKWMWYGEINSTVDTEGNLELYMNKS